jgi:quercetin dioxygenase-like cupin family protein
MVLDCSPRSVNDTLDGAVAIPKRRPVMPSHPAPPDGPVSPASLVEVQEGAIVSRIVLKKETGSITVFAFDAGQSLSEHTVPFDAWIQVLDGTARITVDGRPHRVAAGEAIVLPGGKSHAVHAETAFTMILTMIRS